ncbi:hypothetical protein NIES4071_99830 [Calothrix sp. NIES-4071]|nr:hypothetical protein NIES4071_99830 [Calothrix sp. NIES-4071]BAZ64245.1 hypothetical protein NIES4105_99760 [Calothrix sp. NIES-4105]
MKTRRDTYFRRFLAASLLVSSSFGAILPVLAQVASGTEIKNTATATFSDGTNTYNATSNEVVITVAEVAGITITAQTPSVTNPNAGAQVYVDFVITNTGNDPTQFFIPGIATLTGTAATGSAVGTLQIMAVNGTNLSTPVNVPGAGGSTGTLLANNSISPTIGAGGTITVRVPVTVAPGATQGQTINVTLGEIANPADPTKTQNLDRTGNENQTKDVYTVDNNNGQGGETNATAPINGVREAMTTSSTITVNARLQAFSTVLKAVSHTPGAPNDISDDILTYGLALKVESPSTLPSGLVASDLYGTALRVDGFNTTPYVLVSDAIPTGMKLGTATPNTPNNNWKVVYTTDALSVNALNANWSTTRPTSGTITRVGFVYDTNTNGALRKGEPAITGFNFTVTPDTGFTGGQVANIAQTFGQSQPGSPVSGTATQIVYDESGDKTPNNGLGGANPDPSGQSGANGGITDGKANPTVDGTDPGTGTDPTAANTNTGTDGNGNGTKSNGGETNVYTIAATPLNGPFGKPGATGPTSPTDPTGTNSDFTNKSIQGINKPSNQSLTDAETPEITFNNTVKNTSGSPQEIILLPTPPTGADTLINGTKVTITADGKTASYTYTNGAFVFDSGVPVKITVSVADPNDPTKGIAQYTVKVNLPDAPQFTGYSVPITAFVDVDGNGQFNNEPSNVTIDRVYTNYLKLEKKARLLEANGNPVAGAAGNFTTDQSILAAAATPGRIIEYQITYTNVSTTGGTDSVTLPANNLVITENGTTGNNTWFSLTVDPQYQIQQSGIGTATSSAGTINVNIAANSTVNDIQTYTNTVTTVAPGSAPGTFSFRRKIK